jgi:hypothetical protein
MSWWQQPYKGGPMVDTPPLPRPLYPPDANRYGKKASVDGPDVVAYKRTVARAGRWPWQSFDDSMSNAFSHGQPQSGGNVGQSGIAGVQRQQHLDATGWVGKNTYNTLRSIRVPTGPHKGEMAMDAYSVELLQDAWDMFAGHEPDDQGLTVRAGAVALAQADVGYVEAEGNDNRYGAWYGMNYQPWCAIACTYWYEHAGGSPSFTKGSSYSYVPYPVAGDLVCFDWDWDEEFDHVGLFHSWQTGGNFWTVEGNTAPSSSGSQSNGGGVYQKTRNLSGQQTVFVRVTEPA